MKTWGTANRTDSTEEYGTDSTEKYGADSTEEYGTDSTEEYGTESTEEYGRTSLKPPVSPAMKKTIVSLHFPASDFAVYQ